MTEVDDSAAIEAQEAAYHVENDPAKANALYLKSIGNVDPFGTEAPAPVVEVPGEAKAEGGDEPAGPSPDDIQGAAGRTSFTDEYAAYSSLPEQEQDKIFDSVLELADPNTSRGLLQRQWPGDEYAANLAFSAALVEAVPGSLEAVRVLEAVGMIDHPAIVKWMVAAGRLMATTPGDSNSIPTATGDQTMPSMNTAQIEAKIDTIQDDIERAQAVNDDVKANALFAQQQGLYRLLPGGGDPIIGSQGRTL